VKSGELPDGIVSEIGECISDAAIRESSAKLLPAGTLLIALYGATVGKLGIALATGRYKSGCVRDFSYRHVGYQVSFLVPPLEAKLFDRASRWWCAAEY
jgi:hypothetical protein